MTAVSRTDRLRLEPIGPQHVDDVARMLADPQVAETMGGLRDRAFTEQATAVHVARWEEYGFGLWAAYSQADGGFVGRGGIQHTVLEDVDVVEAAWCLMPSRWGHGFATEIARAGIDLGFGSLGLAEIVAFTLPHNVRSRAVMERLAMRYVRECVFAELPHVLYAVRSQR